MTDVETKQCTECERDLPLSHFHHRKDSRRPHLGKFPISRCKDCKRADLRERQAKRREEAEGRFENDAVRWGKREAGRRAYRRGVRGSLRRIRRHYREVLKDRAKAQREAEREANWSPDTHHPGMTPEQARKKLNNAVSQGIIERPDTCEGCGCTASGYQLHAHHDDYEYPMRVRWLCVSCHADEHAGEWGGSDTGA